MLFEDEGYKSGDSSPLLDVSNDIERRSDDWPIDPEGNSVILSNSFMDRFHLEHPFGKPKRLILELFIMVNMAQLMYTAMIAFAKSAMVASNVSVLNLCLYRFAVLVLIEAGKQVIFPQEEKIEKARKQYKQCQSPHYLAWLENQK